MKSAHQHDNYRDQHRESGHHRRDSKRGSGGVESVMEPERGQYIAVAPRPTSRDNKDGRKIAKGPKGREQRADEIEVRKKRESDMDKTADANRPVNFRRVINVTRDRHSGGEEDHSPERHPFPGVSDNICADPEPPIIEPDRAVDTEQSRQQAIDQTLFLQHPVE